MIILLNSHLQANHLSYKSRNDLNSYKANQLESTFIETIKPQ